MKNLTLYVNQEHLIVQSNFATILNELGFLLQGESIKLEKRGSSF